MANKKNTGEQKNTEHSEEREEYIRSLEGSIKFLKNELDRLNNKINDNSFISHIKDPIENHIFDIVEQSTEFDIINTTHKILLKYFSVIESNFYFKNDQNDFCPVCNTDTSILLDKQIEHLIEQGIVEWVFFDKKIKIIPNLDAATSKQSSYIIFPIIQDDEDLGLFLAGTTLNQDSFNADALDGLSKTLTIASLSLLNKINKQDKSDIQKRFNIINQQLMQNSMLLSVGEISGSVSREIENPIMIIKANVDLILRGIGNSSRRAEIITQNISRIEYLNSIIKGIAFENAVKLEEVVIQKLIDETLNILEFQISNEDIRIEKSFESEPMTILCYKSQIQHVLLNLFLNARDAMPNGGRLSIGCYILGGKRISISIADTGIGINELQLEHIFEPNYSHKTSTNKISLSLYMTKRIINNHKGKISVVSEVGKGTTFKIILPITRSEN